MSKKLQWDKINWWASEWAELPEEGNEARRKVLADDIFMELFLGIPDAQRDALGLFFEKDWKHFDPNKSRFESFFEARIELRQKDLYVQDSDGKRTRASKTGEKDPPNQDTQKTSKKVFHASMNAPVTGKDGSETEYGQGIADTHTEDAYEAVELDAQTYEFIAMILELPNRLRGRANNPERINYYRMFFTDNVSNSLRTDDIRSFHRYERELLRAMKKRLLDYIYMEKCRSIREIIEATIKLYGEVVEGRKMEPMKQPLPNDVYTTYLYEIEQIRSKNGGKLGESTISNQKTAYYDFLRQNLSL